MEETAGRRAPADKGTIEGGRSIEAGRAPPDAPARVSQSVLVWGLTLAGVCLVGASLALAAAGLPAPAYPGLTALSVCVLEALQNVAKYGRASGATVRLLDGGDHLTFEVADDGVGFDASSTSYGTGLQGMVDRLRALGGELEIRSAPGNWTTIVGQLPVRAVELVG